MLRFCPQRVENLREPRPLDESYPTVSLQFPAVDITPAILDIKEYYSELANSLKVHCTLKHTDMCMVTLTFRQNIPCVH